MQFLFPKPSMPRPDQVLPGRSEAIVPSRPHFVNGRSITPPYPDGFEVADFGMGCFWGAEKDFWSVRPGRIVVPAAVRLEVHRRELPDLAAIVMRDSSRRVCSSGLTSSQYFSRMMPDSTMDFSTSGTACRNRLACSSVQKPITRSTPARLYQLRSKITTLARGRQVRQVALDVHLRFFPLGRSGQAPPPETRAG